LGYITQEISFTGQSRIDVALLEDASQLDEVVVIGYGTVKKEDLTGSVDVVTSDNFNQGAIISADQLLIGKAPGVRITNSGGQPDAAPNIRIRGGASLSAQNSPLLVIDGVAIDNRNPAGVSNPLNLINPNDIESFTVLKDASATAIYGARASNGVIIITTKRGTSGEVLFNFSANSTISSVGEQSDMMNGYEYTRFIQEYFGENNLRDHRNLLGVPVGSVSTSQEVVQIIETPDGPRAIYNTNWQDAIYRTAVLQDYNFSARANLFESIPFRASVGYNNAEGIVRTNDYERVSASLKLNPSLLDEHLKIDFNAKGTYTNKNAIDEGGALGGAINMDPTKPIYDDNSAFGGYFQNITDEGRLDGTWNPLALLQQRTRPEKAYRILGNVEFDYKFHFLPDLRAVVNLGLEASRAEIKERFSDNAIATYRIDNTNDSFVFNPGVNYQENQHITNTTLESYLVYTKSYESNFLRNLEVQGGYAYQNFKNDGNRINYQYNPDTGIREELVNENNLNNRYFNELNLQSFFGRANLNFLDKYLLTLSFRADASSLFVKDDVWDSDVWGIFPAAALAWKIKEETFLKNSTFVSDLKLRLSYGLTGQQDIVGSVGFYPSTPLFVIGSATSQYLEGVTLYSANAFNPNLTWEKTTTYNAGLDFEFFSNRLLSGAVDFYYRETTDLLARTPLPPGQGLTDSFIQNVGETESKGFELNLNLHPVQSEHVNLEFNSNIAYNITEITDLKDVSSIPAGESGLPTGTGVFLARHAVGEEAYSAWVFRQVYDTEGNPIPGAFVDLNGDNQITNDDRYYKPLRPNWTFGFGFTFNYKNLDVSSSFRGQLGGNVYNARRLTSGWTERVEPNNTQSLNNVLDFYSGAANPVYDRIVNNDIFSDYFLEDATFLRCENIVVGYRIPDFYKDLNLRVFAAVNNPFLIAEYNGQDPENFNAIDNNFYPRPTSFTLGLNLDF